jgi:uncharacterized LabA/DUF88 family protein
MRFYAHERLALMVDGPNLRNAVRALGFDVDFAKLQGFIARQGTLVSSCYFTQLKEGEDFNPVRPLVDWLDYNDWQVVTRERETAVDLAVHALEMSAHLDHLILASGNSDFVALVEAVQRRACRVSILSTTKAGATGGGCADELRRSTDHFIELADLRDLIARPARAPKEALQA